MHAFELMKCNDVCFNQFDLEILLVWKDFGGLTVQIPFRQQISICTLLKRLMELSLEFVAQTSLAINGESEVQESTPARLVAARTVRKNLFFIVKAVAI